PRNKPITAGDRRGETRWPHVTQRNVGPTNYNLSFAGVPWKTRCNSREPCRYLRADTDAALGQRAGSMLNCPIFCPHFHVEIIAGEGVFLLSNSRQTLLRGRLYQLVAPWLDGRASADVCERLRGKASPAEVYYA